MKHHPFFLPLLVCFTLCLGLISTSYGCSRILHVGHDQSVLVGRTMDWSDQSMKTRWWVYPRGIKRAGGSEMPIRWTSQYGSIVTTAYENITTDGINERGFAAHILWLDESDYGKRDQTLPALSVVMWAQYYLDHFQTVDEAVTFTRNLSFQVRPFKHPQAPHGITVHLALEDAKGDSAIIEYINGKPQIYHHRSYTVLTNSPTYDEQLKSVSQFKNKYNSDQGNEDKPLPGTTNSTDRFIRADFYLNRLPTSSAIHDKIASLNSVLQNVAQPFGEPSVERSDISPTIWRVISDLTHKVYYFNAANSLNMMWVSLDQFNFQPDAPRMMLDLSNNKDIAGDASKHFKVITE